MKISQCVSITQSAFQFIRRFALRFPHTNLTFLKFNCFNGSAMVVVVVVITPSLPRDGGTARTAIQVHAVNLIEIRLRERWQSISNQS